MIIRVGYNNRAKRIIKNIFIIFCVNILLMTLVCCKNKLISNLNSFETKIYESLLIAKQQIPDFENKNIQNVYNLIEDKEYYVLIEISDKWYVLAIDDYDISGGEELNPNAPYGLKITLKAKKGDIAEAVDIMVDMANVGIVKYGESSYESALKLNEAFALKIPTV